MATNVNAKTSAPRLQVRGIKKAFGQNVVLKGIDLSVDAGDVLALIGGNGAGKSTLMKIIMGIYTCDGGDILIDGKQAKLGKPAASLAAGIYLVPQEPLLFPNMTVLENILMGFNENEGELRKRLEKHMEDLGFNLNLQRKANTLSIAEQQLVELLRGMMRNAQILILDEPTSALTFGEVQALFKVVADLRRKGIAIIYITHRLTEVFEIATDVAIMRDGLITLEGPVANFTKEMLIAGLLPKDVEAQQQDENSLLHFVKQLIAYHKANPALWAEGELEVLDPGYPFVYTRSAGDKKVLVAINPSGTCRYCKVPEFQKVIFNQNTRMQDGLLVMEEVSFLVAEL